MDPTLLQLINQLDREHGVIYRNDFRSIVNVWSPRYLGAEPERDR